MFGFLPLNHNTIYGFITKLSPEKLLSYWIVLFSASFSSLKKIWFLFPINLGSSILSTCLIKFYSIHFVYSVCYYYIQVQSTLSKFSSISSPPCHRFCLGLSFNLLQLKVCNELSNEFIQVSYSHNKRNQLDESDWIIFIWLYNNKLVGYISLLHHFTTLLITI